MPTAFTASTDISFDQAINLARTEFPQIDFSKAVDPTSLERILLENNQLLFVDVNFDMQTLRALSEENKLAAEIEASLDTMDCPPEQPVYTEADIEFDPCEIPPEFPPVTEDIDVSTDMEQLTKILNDQYGSLLDPSYAGPKDDVTKILECKAEMEQITANIEALVAREQNIKVTYVALEELLYNYRVMESFFRKRLEVLDRTLSVFNPLVTRKREIESQLDIIEPQYNTALSDFTDADAIVSTGVYTNAQYNSWVSKKALYDDLNNTRNQLLSDQDDVLNSISYERSLREPFNNELLTDAEELVRQATLVATITGLLTDVENVFGTVSTFTSRVNLQSNAFSYNPFSGNSNSFKIEIENKFVDDLGILVGRPKRYLNRVTIPEADPKPSGVLYDRLYNIWGDIEQFFTRQERGLTDNASQVSPDLKDTGAESINGNFIASTTAYSDFYQNFAKKWSEKVALVKATVIEPSLRNTVSPLELFAQQEVLFLLAYGRTFEELPTDNGALSQVINFVRSSSKQFMSDATELRQDFRAVEKLYNDTLKAIETEKTKYNNTPCAQNTDTAEGARSAAGNDPLGLESLRKTDPSLPNPTKWCYWLKFAALTTAVNILPIPGPGGYRYWPIGFTVPSPNGLIKIPLPIVWIPIAVIPLPVGLFVIFIAQCGICPSPVVFYHGMNGEKKFIISLRPGTEFGFNADTPVIKKLLDGGIAVMANATELINKIDVPTFKPVLDSSSGPNLIDDLKNTILTKISKLGVPEISGFNLGTGSTLSEKKSAYKKAIMDHISKMNVPSIKIPKDGSSVNPKPLPVNDLIDALTKLTKMQLPSIAIPPTAKIDLTAKLFSKVKDVKVPDLNIEIPEVNAPDYSPKVKAAMKKIMSASVKLIDSKALGILAVADDGITFLNPYKCGPDMKGLSIPPIPGPVALGITALGQAVGAPIDALTNDFIKGLGPINPSNIANKTIESLRNKIPSIEVPDPSKVNIKDLIMDSVKKIAKLQLPPLPDPTKLPQPRILIPGSAVEAVITQSVGLIIDAIPAKDINFDISPIDLKVIITDIVESAFSPLENFLAPFLSVISIYQSAKDKTFSEILGLGKCSPDNLVALVTEAAFEAAMLVVAKMSLAPFPAVAIASPVFQKLHPVLNYDDLPPWERLSLNNFLFVAFLDQWNVQGKKTCGFFENP